jgi:hypothetical protein
MPPVGAGRPPPPFGRCRPAPRRPARRLAPGSRSGKALLVNPAALGGSGRAPGPRYRGETARPASRCGRPAHRPGRAPRRGLSARAVAFSTRPPADTIWPVALRGSGVEHHRLRTVSGSAVEPPIGSPSRKRAGIAPGAASTTVSAWSSAQTGRAAARSPRAPACIRSSICAPSRMASTCASGSPNRDVELDQLRRCPRRSSARRREPR